MARKHYASGGISRGSYGPSSSADVADYDRWLKDKMIRGDDIPVKEIEPPAPEPATPKKSPGGYYWNKGGSVKRYQEGGKADYKEGDVIPGSSPILDRRVVRRPVQVATGEMPETRLETEAFRQRHTAYMPDEDAYPAYQSADKAAARKSQSFRQGGAVKAGSPRVSAPCTDTKVCKR